MVNDMNKIVAIVVTYNRLELLKENVKALVNQSYIDQLDIIIIDNASTDGTDQYLKSINIPNIFCFNTGKNIGGAGGFNYGLKIAIKKGYNYFWLMDDDTIPDYDALEKLVLAKKILNNQYGFLSSKVLWKDNTPCLMNEPKYFNSKIDMISHKNYIPIKQASFVSIFISKKIVKEVGLPIKEFFIWGDDVEYTRRISIIFKKPGYLVKNSIVHHFMNVNRGSNIAIDTVNRIQRYRFAYRNEFFTYRQEGFWGLCYYFTKCFYNILRIIFKSSDYRIKRLKVLIKAIIEGASFNPKIEKMN